MRLEADLPLSVLKYVQNCTKEDCSEYIGCTLLSNVFSE
jgi:hypothetical protein